MTTEQNQTTLKPNMTRVGELMSAITPQMTTVARFRLNLPAQDALNLLTAAYKYEVERRQRRFILDENTESSLSELAKILTNPSPKFGIMCCGTCGNGKTTLLYAFQRVVNYLEARRHFSFLDDEYRQFRAGIQIFDVKEVLQIAKDLKAFKEIKERPMIALDDLGKEPAEIAEYGNVTTPIIDLIDYRYNRQLFTFITSNLVGSEIRAKYKDRIADRFNEMLHTIVFRGKTYREK